MMELIFMKGMIALRKLLALLLAVLLLSGCAAVPAEAELPPTTAAPTAVPITEPESTRKIAGYLPNGEPYYEDQIFVPEPFYYDEYGARHWLVEGTVDEYHMDVDYVEVVETPESTAFTEIMYYHYHSTLIVTFRNSEATYHYYDVAPETWVAFKSAESKGGFFNEKIKGYYEYDKE
jgi:hypothetical protein